jgi:hypothetical protein
MALTTQTTRAKFRAHSVYDLSNSSRVVALSPVYDSNPTSENHNFWNATPSGEIRMTINNPDGAAIFEEGKEYYVDFTPAT